MLSTQNSQNENQQENKSHTLVVSQERATSGLVVHSFSFRKEASEHLKSLKQKTL